MIASYCSPLTVESTLASTKERDPAFLPSPGTSRLDPQANTKQIYSEIYRSSTLHNIFVEGVREPNPLHGRRVKARLPAAARAAARCPACQRIARNGELPELAARRGGEPRPPPHHLASNSGSAAALARRSPCRRRGLRPRRAPPPVLDTALTNPHHAPTRPQSLQAIAEPDHPSTSLGSRFSDLSQYHLCLLRPPREAPVAQPSHQKSIQQI